MKLTEIRKKIKYLQGLLKEYDMLTALINSMKKCQKQKLDINKEYFINCIKRQEKIETELNNILN